MASGDRCLRRACAKVGLIACVPFKYGINVLFHQQIMLLADGIADLRHHWILSLLLFVTKTEIDGLCKWFVF